MYCTSTEDYQYTQKKVKKTKSGLWDNWIERMLIESDDDDWQTQTATIPCSGSSAMSATGSSHPMTQPNSDDKPKGGITDDAEETEEHRKLPGKAIALESLKSYYGGRSSTSEMGVSIATIFEFAAHWSLLPNRSTLWPVSSPPFQFPLSLNQTQVPMCGAKRAIDIFVTSPFTFRLTSLTSSHPVFMNILAHSLPGSNHWRTTLRDFG